MELRSGAKTKTNQTYLFVCCISHLITFLKVEQGSEDNFYDENLPRSLLAIEDAQAISDHKPKSKLAIADQPKEELSPSKLSKSKRKQSNP